MSVNKIKSSTQKIKIKLENRYIYHKNPNGMGGIAVAIDSGETISILENAENFALDKDEVIVTPDNEKSGITYGRIASIIKHNTTHLSGIIKPHKNQLFLRVSDRKFGHYLVIIKSVIGKIDREHIFNSIITSYPNENRPYFEVELTNSVAIINEDVNYIANLLKDAMVPTEFSQSTQEFVAKIPEQIETAEINSRLDLRKLPFVTIDGADAKDFDDAVYCEVIDNTYHLYVAIADVAHYVTTNSALDRDAYLRGTSIYLPKDVIPMLPEKLSNGLCSLNPHVDRLVMCCHMQIDMQGELISYNITNAVIHSAARLTYAQVQDWLNDLSFVPSELLSNISNLYLVYQALLIKRHARGAIDFDTVEPVFIFDDNGVITALEARVRLETHKLIEECMLIANVCVANFLQQNNHPTLFRVHEKPDEEKFNTLKDYLNSLAIPFNVSHSKLTPRHYANLLNGLKNNPQFATIQQAVLRSMQLAMYSPNNSGHFGLSYTHYTHFTSPIRRYPDLLVHRALKQVLLGQEYVYPHNLADMGLHTSSTERRAEELERKADSFYKCQFAKMHIGKTYAGIITTVVNFGVFVYLPDLLIDGLLHVTELGKDYFVFDEKKQILVGRSNGFIYHAGQTITVEIAGVNMAKLFIDFGVADKK